MQPYMYHNEMLMNYELDYLNEINFSSEFGDFDGGDKASFTAALNVPWTVQVIQPNNYD
jgi:hypothetical protein